MTPAAAPAVPVDVKWWVRPGELVAHAFSTGPGWSRSCCLEARWSAAVQEPPEDSTPCEQCWELVAGAAS